MDRVEIGYTWYGARWQRTHVNTACKLLLLGHAFETLGCRVVGFRTDNFNFRSQQAIGLRAGVSPCGYRGPRVHASRRSSASEAADEEPPGSAAREEP